MVHAEVYDLAEHPRKGLDQRHDCLDGRHCRREHIAQIQAADVEARQFLLDALQPFGGGELAEDLFDFVSNARDFPGERIKDGKATLTKYLADDVPHIFKMVAQQGNHRNHGSKACNRWAEGSKQ